MYSSRLGVTPTGRWKFDCFPQQLASLKLYDCLRFIPLTVVKCKTMGGNSNYALKAFLLLGILLATFLGTGYTRMVMNNVCAVPGDPIHLVCEVPGAANEDTRMTFFKGSTPINPDTDNRVHGNGGFIPKCRKVGSKCKWDLKEGIEITHATASDAGVYRCEATDNNRSLEANATVFVQHHTEVELPTSMAVELGGNVTVKPDRKCDKSAPVRVTMTRTSQEGPVEVPHQYSYEVYLRPYIDRQLGFLVIKNFQCADEGNYTFTIIASRDLKPVFTSISIYIHASCNNCCQEDTTVTSTTMTSGQVPTRVGVTAALRGDSEPETGADYTPYVVVIAILFVCSVILVFLVVRFWKRDKNRRSYSPSTAADNEARDPGTRRPSYSLITLQDDRATGGENARVNQQTSTEVYFRTHSDASCSSVDGENIGCR